MEFDEHLFEDECILPFEMEGREKVFVEDAAGRILVVRAPTVDEWHYFNLREQAKLDAEEEEAEYYRQYNEGDHGQGNHHDHEEYYHQQHQHHHHQQHQQHYDHRAPPAPHLYSSHSGVSHHMQVNAAHSHAPKTKKELKRLSIEPKPRRQSEASRRPTHMPANFVEEYGYDPHQDYFHDPMHHPNDYTPEFEGEPPRNPYGQDPYPQEHVFHGGHGGHGAASHLSPDYSMHEQEHQHHEAAPRRGPSSGSGHGKQKKAPPTYAESEDSGSTGTRTSAIKKHPGLQRKAEAAAPEPTRRKSSAVKEEPARRYQFNG